MSKSKSTSGGAGLGMTKTLHPMPSMLFPYGSANAVLAWVHEGKMSLF